MWPVFEGGCFSCGHAAIATFCYNSVFACRIVFSEIVLIFRYLSALLRTASTPSTWLALADTNSHAALYYVHIHGINKYSLQRNRLPSAQNLKIDVVFPRCANKFQSREEVHQHHDDIPQATFPIITIALQIRDSINVHPVPTIPPSLSP